MSELHLPEYSQPISPESINIVYTLIGAWAVTTADTELHYALMADHFSAKAETIEALRQAGLPDPRLLVEAEKQALAAAGDPFFVNGQDKVLGDWLQRHKIFDYNQDGVDHKAAAEQSRSLEEFSARSLTEALDRIRTLFAEKYTAPRRTRIDEYFAAASDVPERFKAWKAASEVTAGKQMTWVEWLATKPEGDDKPELVLDADNKPVADIKPSATDAQLLNVLQWSTNRVLQTDRDPAFREEREERLQRMDKALEVAVQRSWVSPKLLTSFRQTAPETQVFTADIFDYNLAGQAIAHYEDDKRLIVLTPGSPFEVETHERLHAAGGFDDRLPDEGVTQLFTKMIVAIDDELQGKVGQDHEDTHFIDTEIMSIIQQLSGLTSYEVSELYAGEDDRENEVKLRSLIKERTDTDWIGSVLEYRKKWADMELERLLAERDQARETDAVPIPLDPAELIERENEVRHSAKAASLLRMYEIQEEVREMVQAHLESMQTTDSNPE